MACESCCLAQARTMLYASAVRWTVSKSPVPAWTSRITSLPLSRTPAPCRAPYSTASRSLVPPRRCFSSSSSHKKLLGGIGGLAESYRVLGSAEKLYKTCARGADYTISEEARKNDTFERLEDGEEVGVSRNDGNVWHKNFQLKPTFSTWSHVTMLHLYLLNARVRCFDREGYRNWQQQLVDHFFFDCEKKMHVDHNITSSALRQRYLKDIFVQWRGLLLAYDEGLVKGDAVLASAIWRNLFKGVPDVDPRWLLAIVGWMRASLASLEATSDFNFPNRAGEILEKPVEPFWTRVEEPFKKAAAGGGEGGQAKGAAPAGRSASGPKKAANDAGV